ncbi:MAG: AAA family ATPase [Thermodesulfobacteriota bacterium]
MPSATYKPLEVARMVGVSKELLLEHERDGRLPLPKRDDKGNRYYTAEDVELIRERVGIRPALANPPVVVAVFNMKGGVGKSTVSSNFAWKAAEMGFRVLGLDADPQGHMTTSLGKEPADFTHTLQQLIIPDQHKETLPVSAIRAGIAPNLDLVPANLSMCELNLFLVQQPEREYRLRRELEKVKAAAIYDLVVIDSPPSYDLTSQNILLACDLLIAPVKLDGNSFYGLEYLFNKIRELKRIFRYQIPAVLIVANHYNQSYSVSRDILDGLEQNYGQYLARTVVRQDVNFDKANALREPIFVNSPSCKGSADMANLTTEVIDLVIARYAKHREEQE